MSFSLLLLSSSRAGQTDYLQHAKDKILSHLDSAKNVIFIPFAGVTIGYDQYTDMVQSALPELNIKGIHQCENMSQELEACDAIMVGGGNTFHLLHQLYEHNLIEFIGDLATSGKPYVGWSAGSNIAGLSIRTTNDMPIIEPKSFTALNLVPFQINPHYTDYQPPNHNGETRAQRLEEFMVLNPQMPILAIKEGTALVRNGDNLSLWGDKSGFVFKGGEQTSIDANDDLSHYLIKN